MADTATTVTVDPAAIAREVRRSMQAEGGDAKEVLVRQNVKYRARLAALTAELEAAKKQAPADGSVVLTAEQAKTWAAFEALKLEPAKITEALAERDTLKATDATRTKQDAMRTAADAAGYRPGVLAELRAVDGLTFTTETEKDDKGEPVKVAYVTAAEAGAKPRKLAEYMAEKHPDLLSALTADAAPPRPTGTPFRGQVETGTQAKPKPVTVEEIAAAKQRSGQYHAI